MTDDRLSDYLEHIRIAASDALGFVQGMPRDQFMQDRRTQQAVIMSLIIVGEAATKIMDDYAEFAAQNEQIQWRSMRNMRNRMAHGYFDIDLTIVWDTVQDWLPKLLIQLPKTL